MHYKVAGMFISNNQGQKNPPQQLNLKNKKPPIILSRVTGGIHIRSNAESDTDISRLTVRFAYDVRNGDPFKRYLPVDFDLKDASILVQTTGLETSVQEENTLEFDIVQSDFEVLVTGFDGNRDLKVRVNYKEA